MTFYEREKVLSEKTQLIHHHVHQNPEYGTIFYNATVAMETLNQLQRNSK